MCALIGTEPNEWNAFAIVFYFSSVLIIGGVFLNKVNSVEFFD
jgi:hypothetical protein